MTSLEELSEDAAHFPDCCPGISTTVLSEILSRLPESPALTLSIGCGSGLLEAFLLHASEKWNGRMVNLCGVEVTQCVDKYLPEARLLRVPSTESLHTDAMLASVLMFVYPRMNSLITSYLDNFKGGALEKVLWLGHRNELPDIEKVLRRDFALLQIHESAGFAESEVLVMASNLRCT